MKQNRHILSIWTFTGLTFFNTYACAGAIENPIVRKDVVQENMTDVYKVRFRGGEYAHIFVSGDGSSDLDLYVYDENGNLICKDDDDSDDMECFWKPPYSTIFRVEIKNRGDANSYTLMTN